MILSCEKAQQSLANRLKTKAIELNRQKLWFSNKQRI